MKYYGGKLEDKSGENTAGVQGEMCLELSEPAEEQM